MKTLTSIYALSFFITFSLSLLFGLHMLVINPKERLNRHCFMTTIVLCFWAFGFAMSIMAKDAESALFWRRFSAVGRTMIHAFLLHMVIILTGREERLGKLKIFLLYIPALIGLYVFSLSPTIAAQQYSLVLTSTGWASGAVSNIFNNGFHVYYSLYMIINFVLIIRWRAEDVKNKVQADILLKGFSLTLGLGLFTDLVLDVIYDSGIPPLGPMLSLIPLLTIFYLTRKDNLMKKSEEQDWDLILTKESRRNLFTTIAYLYLGGGMVNFFQYFLPQLMHSTNEIKNVIQTSIIFFICGILVLLVQFIKNEKLRDNLFLLTVLASIPAVTLAYLPTSAVTIWVLPVILIIIFVVFDTRFPLVAIMVVGVLTQLIVWQFAPQGPVPMDEADYLLRAAIIVITYSIGFTVNKIYIKRLKENIYQAKLQKAISDTSFNFINTDKANFEENLHMLLQKIGSFVETDNSYVYKFNTPAKTVGHLYQWTKNRAYLQQEEPLLMDLPLENFPWLRGQLKSRKMINIEAAKTVPREGKDELKALGRSAFKSLLIMPIEKDDKIAGLIGFETQTQVRKWTEHELQFLKTMANMLTTILIKIRTEEEIEYLAYYDHLTGIPNRTLFSDRLTQALHLARRNDSSLGVILMDLDNFKLVNDTMEHNAGDDLLKKMAKGLKKLLRSSDTVARFGGDEFLILVNDLQDEEGILTVVHKLMDFLKEPIELDGHNFYTTASMGIAVYPRDGEDAETLIKNADIAMYHSKLNGKGQHCLCTAKMKEDVKINMKLSGDLYNVENKEELVVYYQPQISIRTGQIVGLEALLRWRHPELGMISPGYFIPLAEVNGTIYNIGDWVLKTALKQTKKWHLQGFDHLRIAVNLSVVQFHNPGFAESLYGIIEESRLNPEFLELEITESVATENTGSVQETLEHLKKMGLSISIDDFGTDYSSLKRLKMMPIDRIKVDMHFVQGLEVNEKDRAIARVIINLAKSLGISVLAEGVETKGQLDFLRLNHCDEVQGFYYYKPMPPNMLEDVLRAT